MAKVGGGNIATDFVKGVVVGSNDKDASAAQVVGDVAGALVPGLGEIKAVQDIFEGAKSGNPALVVGGLVGLIPVVGAAGKAGGKVATKAGAKVATKTGEKVAAKAGAKIASEAATKASGKALAKAGAEVAEQSFKASALQLGRLAQKTITQALEDPKTQEKLGEIATHAGERGLDRLVQRLTQMQSEGRAPELITREHSTFAAARDAAFAGIGEKPGKDWDDLVLPGAEGKRDVVGRHLDGERGFRILADAPESGASTAPLKLYWWKDGGLQDKDLTFGIEQCDASPAAVKRIQEAYLNRNLSFRRRMG